MFARPLVPLLAVAALAGAQCSSGPGDRLTGSWGGDGAGMIVSVDKATVSYTCGETTINGPIALDEGGRFEAAGEHVRRGGAPPQPGSDPERHPAHVAGRIRDATMALTVRLTDVNQVVGTFVLVRGAPPSVLGCP